MSATELQHYEVRISRLDGEPEDGQAFRTITIMATCADQAAYVLSGRILTKDGIR